MALESLYFGVTEGVWGASIGKAVLNLRVVGPGGGPPGMARAFGRSVIFEAPLLLSWLFGFIVVDDAISAKTFEDSTGWIIDLVLTLLLFVTLRRRNGFATVHDLVTSTRVADITSRNDHSPRTPLAEPAGTGDALSGEKTAKATRLGPYVIPESVLSGDAPVIPADDPVLGRPVWIVRYHGDPSAPAVPTSRRNLARPGRSRWLNGMRAADESWDAYDRVEGLPLLAFAGKPQPWPVVRRWLEDLTREIVASIQDPPTPVKAELDRVWIARNGRAWLLDFPVPGSGPVASTEPSQSESDAITLQHFLDRVATLALEEKDLPDSRKPPVAPRARIPIQARRFLCSIRSHQFADSGTVLDSLIDLRRSRAGIARLHRVASLLTMPLLVCLMIGVIAVNWRRFDDRWAEQFPDLPSPRMLELLYDWEGDDDARIRVAIETLVGARYRDLQFDTARSARFIEYADFIRENSQRAETRGQPQQGKREFSPDQVDAAAELVSSRLREVEFRAYASYAAGALIFIILLSAISNVIGIFVGSHLGLGIWGLAVVSRTGAPATRLRLLLRAVTVLLPAMLVGALFVLTFVSASLTAALPWLTLVLGIPGGAFLWVMLTPQRGPHDRIARTWVVPR